MPTVLAEQSVLSDELRPRPRRHVLRRNRHRLLQTFGERAPAYDRENRFFTEDFEDLRLAGYLELAVPVELGGRGMNLAQVCQEQRRLAYRAPATALATNMHIYWTGVAADLLRMGDSSCEWILEEAANGEVFATGHGEAGNDFPVMLSTARAERVDGGYRFYGHKIFGSLTPVWTRLGIHAMDTSDPTQPKVVHAFMPRDSDGYRIVPTWDVLGMRATRSDDTILEGAFVPDRYVPRVVPAGLAGADLFVLGIFAWAEPTFANIYVHVHLLDNIDAHCERARAAGAEIVEAPADQFYGDRTYRAKDPEGHMWTFAQTVQRVSRAEAERAIGAKIFAPSWA